MDEHENVVRREIDRRFKTRIDAHLSDYATGKTSLGELTQRADNIIKEMKYEAAIRYVDTLSEEQLKLLAARFITEIFSRRYYDQF